jgi:hypothetical protein
MVFFTLETGKLGLISEGQLMVRIRQIKSENKNLLNNISFLDILGCKSKYYRQIILSEKKVQCFCKW